MRLRGRERAHKDLAREKINSFLEMIPFEFKIEEEIKKSPRGMTMTICQAKPKSQ